MREKEQKPDELEVRALVNGKEYSIKFYTGSTLTIEEINEAINFLNELKFKTLF